MLSRTQPVTLDQRRILELHNDASRVQILVIDTEWGVQTVSLVGFPSALASSTPFLELRVLGEVCVRDSSFLPGGREVSYGLYLASFYLYHICPVCRRVVSFWKIKIVLCFTVILSVCVCIYVYISVSTYLYILPIFIFSLFQ